LSDGISKTEELCRAVLAAFQARGSMLATAESCTGGMIAAALTDIPGSSAVVDRGFVTYSNAAKSDLLGVDPALIEREGAVSAEVARAMAEGALARSRAAVAVAVTGVAGPGGGSLEKPVGLVWFGLASNEPSATESAIFTGDRSAIRRQSVDHALALLLRGLAALR
jgi:nicotinamide-nucleotide amidase